MNNLQRTVKSALESNIPAALSAPTGKAFQYVKYVTGKKTSSRREYTVENVSPWKGLDTILITGKNGFIRLALTPLFEII